MMSQLRPAVVSLVFFTLLTGLAYPLAMTGLAQAVFSHQANGSLIERNGQIVGSEVIGQPFDNPKYFWSRPSATAPFPYNAAASVGSNLGPTNPALEEAVKARVAALRAADPGNTQPIPVDLVTASGSGLDPHISVAAALYQVPRVARERGLSEDQVRDLVNQHIEGRQLGILGEPRVNVLKLNLALDELS
jgi:K+-transporting ATPase ATPase C chain